jgi:fucose permease
MSQVASEAEDRAGSGPPGRAVPLLALAYLGFISLGLPDGLLGVGWPSMHEDFKVPVGAVGFVLALSTIGYVLSSVAAGYVMSRIGVGWLLAGSTALASVALTGYGLAPALPFVVGFALLLGLGSGAIDSGLNAYAADHFGARHMNWLHASYGLGAMLGPLVMSGVLGAGLAWRWGYGSVALAQAVLAITFALTVQAWTRRVPALPAADPTPQPPDIEVLAGVDVPRSTLRMPTVWLGVLTFAFYTGIEVACGLWAYTVLTEGRGLAAGVAGTCVSAYWGSLFVGRLVFGGLADRLGVASVLLFSMIGMVAGAALIAIPTAAWVTVVGLILLGGSAAPVFPLLTLTTSDRVGADHATRAIGLQIGAAGLAGAAIPAGIGLLLGWFGSNALGVALAALSGVMIALYLAATRTS